MSNELLSTTPSASANTNTPIIKTRFLLLSDTHSHRLHPSDDKSHAYRSPLPHSDVLLHAGDLSFAGEIAEYQRTFDVVRSSTAELKIVIAGNHDLSLDAGYVKDNYRDRSLDADAGGEGWEFGRRGRKKRERKGTNDEWIESARDLWTGEEARRAGIVYLEEGTSTFTLKNGAKFTIYTSPYTPAFCNMAFAYGRDQDRFNPLETSPHPNHDFTAPNPAPSWPAIDIVLTHGPPLHHMDNVNSFDIGKPRPVGCVNQLHALARIKPRLSVFGHIHEGWGAQWVKWSGKTKADLQASDVDVGEGERGGTARFGQLDRDVELEPKEGGQVSKIEVGSKDPEVLERGYAYVDATASGRGGSTWGSESLLVNAAILNSKGRPDNAPWVVDLDLPKASTPGSQL